MPKIIEKIFLKKGLKMGVVYPCFIIISIFQCQRSVGEGKEGRERGHFREFLIWRDNT